jgi:hypothetical protein
MAWLHDAVKRRPVLRIREPPPRYLRALGTAQLAAMRRPVGQVANRTTTSAPWETGTHRPAPDSAVLAALSSFS